ncbi:MAG: glycosyltransferase family 92 protein [Chlamydiia bacterium]
MQASNTIAIATMIRNETPYLKEWVEYHRLLGVSKFWLFDNNSSDHPEWLLNEEIASGLIEILPLPSRHPCHVFPTSDQRDAYHIANGKAFGVFDWIAFIDVDEFIVPMRDRGLPECLARYTDAGAIFVNWRCFGTNQVERIPAGEPILPYLTACSLKAHPSNCVGKTICRPTHFAYTVGNWSPHHVSIKSESPYYNGSGQIMRNCFGEQFENPGVHEDRFIRINHYVQRDEYYFRTRRLENPRITDNTPQARADYFAVLMEQHESYNAISDFKILDLIRKQFPQAWKNLWREGATP